MPHPLPGRRPARAPRAAAVAAFTTLLACAPAADAQSNSPADVLRAFEAGLIDVIERVEPSVVAVSRAPAQAGAAGGRGRIILEGDPLGQFRAINPATETAAQVAGAGVVIDESGLVLTQYLVVKQGERHTVTTYDGKELPATIRGADPRSGLAVLKVDSTDLKPLELGRAEDLKKGRLVVAVGNPYAVVSDGQATASHGIVTNMAGKAPPLANLNNVPRTEPDGSAGFRTTIHHLGALIQTDAPLGWNASGGALVTLDGKLVGVTTTASTIAGHERPAGYAIPVNETMRRVIETLKTGREVEYGLLGIEFQQGQVAALSNGGSGIPVKRVFVGTPAHRAGLRSADVIAQINGRPITDSDALQLVVGSLPPGAEAEVAFQRNGRMQDTVVRLGKYKVPGEQVITNHPPDWQGIHVDYATALDLTALQQAQAQMAAEGCVRVSEVDEGSVAWEHGVRPGMFISHVSGKAVTTPDEFRAAVASAGDSVKLRFAGGAAPVDALPVAGSDSN